jgi:hypothetical protein
VGLDDGKIVDESKSYLSTVKIICQLCFMMVGFFHVNYHLQIEFPYHVVYDEMRKPQTFNRIHAKHSFIHISDVL